MALNGPNHYYHGGVRKRTSGELLLSVAAAPAQLGFYVARYVFPSYAISPRLACSMNEIEKKSAIFPRQLRSDIGQYAFGIP